MGNHLYLAVPLMAVLAVIQTSVLPRFPVLGAVPQILFLVALAWGILRGLEQGLFWAFIAGLFVDLFSLAPMGISSLAFMAGVAGPVLLLPILPPRRLLVAILLAGLGTIIYLAVYLVALRLFGHGMAAAGLLDFPPLIMLHLILIVPIYVVLANLVRVTRPRRVEF
jgi:rod shape-determining protein MreD